MLTTNMVYVRHLIIVAKQAWHGRPVRCHEQVWRGDCVRHLGQPSPYVQPPGSHKTTSTLSFKCKPDECFHAMIPQFGPDAGRTHGGQDALP